MTMTRVRLQQAQVGLRRGGVQNASPEKAAREINDGLDVLPLSLDVSCDVPLFQGYAPFLRLAVDCRKALVPAVSVRLHHDEHVLPLGVDDSL